MREIGSGEDLSIFGDTTQEKPYTSIMPSAGANEDELICWHFDRAQNRTVKGIGRLNCLYHAHEAYAPEGISFPVTFELAGKPYLPGCNQAAIEAICPEWLKCQKRLKVEIFHLCPLRYKALKSNTALVKFPGQPIGTRGNQVFPSIYARFRHGSFSIINKINRFVLGDKLYLKAVRLSFDAFQTLKCLR